MIEASIVICTYRRPQELAFALDGIQRQTAESSQFEVIVVDNDPLGGAAELVQGLFGTIPNLKYVQEQTVGLSLARNRGAEAACGQWVIFLDDDAVPDKFWLQNLFRCFDALHPCWGSGWHGPTRMARSATTLADARFLSSAQHVQL